MGAGLKFSCCVWRGCFSIFRGFRLIAKDRPFESARFAIFRLSA